MGCGDSKPEAEAAPAAAAAAPVAASTIARSADIEKQIKADKKKSEEKIKMLLLGAGESGKSTIFKQMRLLYGTERSDEDIRMYGVVVRSNIIVAIKKLCVHLRALGLEGELDEDPAVRAAYDELIDYVVDRSAPPQDWVAPKDDWVGKSPRAGSAANDDAEMFLAYNESIYTLWQASTMRKVWAKRAAVNVVDSHKLFLDEVPRIAAADYRPTTQDVIVARVRTTHVVQEAFNIEGKTFEIYDVGGQRSERRKWINCFDGVNAVVFVAALSEYDQTLAEAKRSNRMVEALILFQSVCQNRAFNDTSILLFMNKRDIFQEKIMHSDIAAQKSFSEYTGPPKDYDAGVKYFIQKFKACLVNDEVQDKFIHVTCATDTSNMRFVLASAATIIKKANIRKTDVLGD